MFLSLTEELRRAGLSVGPKEHLALLEALDAGVIEPDPEAFYYLARAIFVKDESRIDTFDRVFAHVFKGVLALADDVVELPEDWLRAVTERFLDEDERAAIKTLGSWDEIMDTLRKRLAEQKERHQGGNRWIGTGGTSPFGHAGYNPEGVRIGGPGRHQRAVKVWEKRAFRNLDHPVALGTRNIKLALRRLRRFAREGAPDELDLETTIAATARRGFLDVTMRPQRRNAVKLLLFLDIGGSMDPFVHLCEEVFSALTAEFKHLAFFYFHNCIYESVWTDNVRRHAERTPTLDVLHRFGSDYKLLFVGDARMSPYEITMPGGSVEHDNPEAGAVWMQRLLGCYPCAAWLNPVPRAEWDYALSTQLIADLMGQRMYPLTLGGIDAAARGLMRPANVSSAAARLDMNQT